MTEIDKETRKRAAAADDFMANRMRLHDYVRDWTYDVKVSGRSKDGAPYAYEAATIVLPRSKIIMGLSKLFFKGRIQKIQEMCITADIE